MFQPLRWNWLAVGGLVVMATGCGGSSNGDKCPPDGECISPPASTCGDANTLVTYAAVGSCNPDTGECEYGRTERVCDQGCADGRCVSQDGSWLAAIEVNDAAAGMGLMGAGWFGGVGGYFTEAPAYPRVLPHQVPWICKPQSSAGGCTLYDQCGMTGPVVLMFPCSPECAADEYCEFPTCLPLPAHSAAGALTFEGLKQVLTVEPDSVDRYNHASPPADLFDAGDSLTVRVAGGEIPAFSISTVGVTPLEPVAGPLELLEGQSAQVSWTPAGDGSRVLAILLGGRHEPIPPKALICEADDAAGALTIPAEMADAFRSATGTLLQKFSYLMRISSNTETVAGRRVEFSAGSMRILQVCFGTCE